MNLLRESEDPTTFRKVRDTIGGFYSGLADDPEGRVMHHFVDVPDDFEATHKKLRAGHLEVHSSFFADFPPSKIQPGPLKHWWGWLDSRGGAGLTPGGLPWLLPPLKPC